MNLYIILSVASCFCAISAQKLYNCVSTVSCNNANITLSTKALYCLQNDNNGRMRQCSDTNKPPNPENKVVLVGQNTILNCADAFRWYRYWYSDPIMDRVIFMGTDLARVYNPDGRYYVNIIQSEHPYDRIDLGINNVKKDDFGTYRCFSHIRRSKCAELIVLESHPTCYAIQSDCSSVDLKCNMKVSQNTNPVMTCKGEDVNIFTNCTRDADNFVTCSANTNMQSLTSIECEITFNIAPAVTFIMCDHATNSPAYTYKWYPAYQLIVGTCWYNQWYMWLLIVFLFIAIFANILTCTVCLVKNPRNFLRIW